MDKESEELLTGKEGRKDMSRKVICEGLFPFGAPPGTFHFPSTLHLLHSIL